MVVKEKSFDRLIVDTTAMPKAIVHPTDSGLLETARQHMVAFAKERSLALRQNYNKEAPRLAIQVGRYAHARQHNRMHGSLRKLKSKVERILTQKPKDKNKLHSLHAAEAEPEIPMSLAWRLVLPLR